MKTQMQETAATGRTEKQIAAEKEINQSKIDAELKVKGMDLENNPQTAFQYLQGRYIEETNKGNSALANQYLERAKSAYSNQMQMLWAQSAARNAYNPNLQGLAQGILTNNANVGPGQMPGGGGGGGGGVQVGQEIAPGVRVVGVPGGGGGGGGFAPNMPNIAPVQTQPTQPAQSTPTPVSQSLAGRGGFPGGQQPVNARTAVLSQERDEIMARPDTDPNKQEDLNDINYQIQKVSGIPGATQAPQQPQPQAGPANAAVQKPNPQQAKVQQIQQIAQSLPPDVQQSIKQFEQETPGHGVGRARLHLEMMIDREKEGWTREQLGQAVVLRQRLLQLEQLTR
jgi:hypothetical protein